jgi:hypothetical protein
MALWSLRFVRRRDHLAHRRVQMWLIAVAVTAVLALEVQIRLAGGGGALLHGSRFAGTALIRGITIAHIAGAILTYVAWIGLFAVSYRKYPSILPGRFSRLHRRVGRMVILGLQFTALSAAAVYLLGFVL